MNIAWILWLDRPVGADQGRAEGVQEGRAARGGREARAVPAQGERRPTLRRAAPSPCGTSRPPYAIEAKSLSDYLLYAYLVAFVPADMLPGHRYDTRRIFDAVVMAEARVRHAERGAGA
jgi:hypothetical protein